MAGTAEKRPLESLTLELESLGLSAGAARALSAEFIVRHPFAQRLGLRRLIRELEERGLEESDAVGAAGLLMGIELRDRGAEFNEVIAVLEGLGLDHNDALASALSSARVYRELCSQPQPVAEIEDELLRICAWFGVTILFLALWVRLVA